MNSKSFCELVIFFNVLFQFMAVLAVVDSIDMIFAMPFWFEYLLHMAKLGIIAGLIIRAYRLRVAMDKWRMEYMERGV